jgi:hypothetical protein
VVTEPPELRIQLSPLRLDHGVWWSLITPAGFKNPKPTRLIPRTHTPSLVNDGNCSTVVSLRSTYPLLGSVDTPSNGARVDVDRRQHRNTSDLKPVFDELQQRLVEVLNFFSLLSVFERT